MHLHRSAEHVAAYDDLINRDALKFFQHGFERRQVAVNIVKSDYSHNSLKPGSGHQQYSPFSTPSLSGHRK